MDSVFSVIQCMQKLSYMCCVCARTDLDFGYTKCTRF